MERSTQDGWDYLVATLSPVQGEGEAMAIARIVLEDVFSWKPGRRPRMLSHAEWVELEQLKDRLLAHEPVQYITGRADFYGLQLQVSPAVLIPRPETEELVEWVLERAKVLLQQKGQVRVLDIGTGSGCIPLAIKHECPNLTVSAWDVSQSALEVASANADQLNLEVSFSQVDILDANHWPTESWDIIVSNPPYIPHQEAELMPPSVWQHEPDLALFVENDDPLLFYRTIMQFAQQRGAAPVHLFFECNEYNAPAVDQMGQSLGFTQTTLRKDMQGKDRMWLGLWE